MIFARSEVAERVYDRLSRCSNSKGYDAKALRKLSDDLTTLAMAARTAAEKRKPARAIVNSLNKRLAAFGGRAEYTPNPACVTVVLRFAEDDAKPDAWRRGLVVV